MENEGQSEQSSTENGETASAGAPGIKCQTDFFCLAFKTEMSSTDNDVG